MYEGSIKDLQSGAVALIEGEAGAAFLRLTLQSRDLAMLAKLWIAGVEIDWAQLFDNDTPRRVSLPTYPFTTQRCWLNAPVPRPPPRSAGAITARPEPAKQMLHYESSWQPAELPAVKGITPALGPLLLIDQQCS